MGDDAGQVSRRGFVGAGALAAAALTATAGATQPAAARRARQSTIFATGGGFFPQVWERSLFPEYLLAQTPATTPKICWLGPASGESATNFETFARNWESRGAIVRHFNIYQPETLDFADYLMGMDIVFVGGGSTKNMMALWREWEFDKALRAA